jgi:hypothetical protein
MYVHLSTTKGTPVLHRFKVMALAVIALCVMMMTSSCAIFDSALDDLNRALNGEAATLTTYNQAGQKIDEVHGQSFAFTRDDTFDSTDAEGKKIENSSVIKIAVGGRIIQHVGSTLLLAEDGLIKVSDAPTKLFLDSNDPGRPWLNFLYHDLRNAWKGKARTVMIRSQDGMPIAVFAGDKVEAFAPDIPQATRFEIDGKTLLVYRADYTVYDTSLLG